MKQQYLSIRQAETEDADAISQIVTQAYQHYIERLGKPPGPMLNNYNEIINNHLVYVAELYQEIVGLVVLMEDHHPILLDNIAVGPGQQGKGTGTRLLKFAEQLARDRGHSSMQLYTNELMHENIEYYGRHGYNITAQVKEKGYNRIYMCKELV